MTYWETPAHVSQARKDWQVTLGYGPAEVAMCHMNLPLASEMLGEELTDRIVNDALFAFLGESEDWA